MANARQFLRLTKELVYGTYQALAPAAQVVAFHLPGDNSFTPRLAPISAEERSAGASNRRTHHYSRQREIKGNLTTTAFSSQTNVLIGEAINLTGSPLNLGSFTIDQAIAFDDNSSIQYKRYLGGMVESFGLTSNHSPGGWALKLSFGLIFKSVVGILVGDFTEPDFVTVPHYPTENPWAFQDSSGHFTLGAGLRTSYRDLNISVKNMLIHPHDEGQDIAYCRWSGRDVEASFTSRLLTAVDRTQLEGVTSQAMVIGFTDANANSLTFTFGGSNYTVKVDDNLPLAGDGYTQSVSLISVLGSTGTELTFAQAP